MYLNGLTHRRVSASAGGAGKKSTRGSVIFGEASSASVVAPPVGGVAAAPRCRKRQSKGRPGAQDQEGPALPCGRLEVLKPHQHPTIHTSDVLTESDFNLFDADHTSQDAL